MLIFEKSSPEKINIELEILNSNPHFNLISKDKEQMTYDDLLEEHQEGQELGTERYLIKKGDEYIGILDFLMNNPADQKPWLGLLVIHSDAQQQGFAKEAFRKYEALMKERGIREIRLGVLSNNERAHCFWKSLGFVPYTEKMVEGKRIDCYEKNLLE